MRFRFVLSELAIGLRRNMLMMFAVVVITAFSLLFLGLALLVRSQVTMMRGYWYQQLQVSVYLCTDHSTNPNCPTAVTPQQIDDVRGTLDGLRPLVKSVNFVDQQQAYDIFKQEFKDSPDLVKNTTPDALPQSFVVKLTDPARFDVVDTALSGKAGVDSVQDEQQILKKLFGILNTLRDVGIGASVIGLGAAVVMIGVAVQVAAASRRREIGIMRLVGASNLYIQLPFLIEGVLAGVVGALVGFGGVVGVKYFLIDHSLRPTLRSFGSLVEWSQVFGVLPWMALAGAIIAALASFATLQRHMRV